VRNRPVVKLLEAQVKRASEDWLDLCGPVWIRINPVRPFTDRKTKQIRFAPIRETQKGAPDIIIPAPGSLAVECKSTIGKLSPDQIRWRDRAKEFGIIYSVIRDLDDLIGDEYFI